MKTATNPTCRLCGAEARPENPVDFHSDACARCIESDESELEPTHGMSAADINRLPAWKREGDCCALAVSQHCVCIRSTMCPVHGNRCRGSHE